MLTRRSTLAAFVSLAAGGVSRAQGFPTRPVTIIVPYPAGGPVDLVARLIGQAAAASLGQPILVENRGGGSGSIGTAAAARAEPDGHTLVLGTNQTHATNQSLLKTSTPDAATDFAPVCGLAIIPHVLVVRPGLDVADVGALVARAKAQPGALTCGSTGNGSASHLAAELFKARASVDLLHVPFRGAAPLTTELLAGRIDLSFVTLPSVIAHFASGALKPLALASGQRSDRLRDTPTLAEAGIASVEADAWFALFAPARTPRPTIDRLYQVIANALATPAMAEAFAAQGMTLAVRSPDTVAAWLPGEIEKWARVIRAASVTIE